MEYEPALQKLIKITLRSFYSVPQIVLTDILLTKLILYDTEFCELLKMLSKEFNKHMVKLREDKIIKHETKIETVQDNRQLLRSVYYIDYGEVKNVIKYKIYKMSKLLDAEIKEEEMQGYACINCNKEFTILEAQCLLVDMVFRCDECTGALSENIKTKLGDKHGLQSRLMMEIKHIVVLLKELDKYDIPSMDYFQILKMRKDRESGSMNVEIKEVEQVKEDVLVEDLEPDMQFEEKKEVKEVFVEEKVDVVEIKEFVSVGGEMKLFNDVTDEDIDKMTADEYLEYYNVHSKYEKE